MTKSITTLLFALIFFTGSAWAEWVKIDESDSGSIYIDPQTIRKDGNFRKVWHISDLRQRFKTGELSRRSRLEFDCKNERFRYLSLSTHSERMAGGTTLTLEGEDLGWTDIAPGTMRDTTLKTVCAK